MNKHTMKGWRKILCYVCAISLCLQPVAAVNAKEGDIWTHSELNGVSFRETANHGWYVCAYDSAKDKEKKLSIASSYQVTPTSGSSGAVDYGVRGIDDRVFGTQEDGRNHTFSSIYIEASEGMTIGKSAFQGIVVEGDSSAGYVKVTKGKLAQIGEYAFEGAKINGDLSIAGIKGTIGQGAFSNTTIGGNVTIKNMEECIIQRGAFEQMEAVGTLCLGGSIDTLGECALSGFSAKRISLSDNIVRHMGDRVFYNTKLAGVTYPLSDYLETIGSKVFEGTGVAAIQLPNSNTVTKVAEDAFPDTEGMTIIIPEKLTKLEVYHFNTYQNVTFQVAENLPDDSPVIDYLTKNRLPYKKGVEGDVVIPEPLPQPTPTAVVEPTPGDTTLPIPTEIPEETIKPTPMATTQPTPTDSAVGPTIIMNVTQAVGPTVVQGAVSDQPSPNTQETGNTSSSSNEAMLYKIGKLKYQIAGKNKAAVVGAAKTGVTNIVIPDHVKINGRLYQVTKVRERAFYGQSCLKKVRTGNYIREIGAEAFAMCPRLVHIQFGTGLVKIGKKALYRDKGLRKIIFKGTKLKKIGKKTFFGVSPKKVSIKVKRSKLVAYQKLIQKAK